MLFKAIWLLAVCSLVVVGHVVAQETFQGKSLEQWSQVLAVAEGKEREEAAQAIAQLAGKAAGTPADEEGFAELIKLVNDSDPGVRFWGATGLAMFGQRLDKRDGGRRAAINALEPLLTDKAAAPRIAAAQALGELGQTGAALGVLVAAINDEKEAVRLQAVRALERLGAASAPAEKALRAATNDSSADVREIAVRVLLAISRKQK